MSNVLNYADYNFEDLVIALQDRIKLRDSWSDIYRSGTGQMLIELLAYVLNAGLYYTERRASESMLPTARLLSSVKNLVALLNYEPKRKTSATGTLTFSIAPALNKIVYIPKYTECQSTDGIKYLTNEDAAIQKGQTSVAVNSIQGELLQTEVSANGATNQEYLINSIYVENSANAFNPTLRILVNGEEWTKVDSFINSNGISKHYRVLNDMEGTVTIKFGDNVNGLAPSSGASIIIKYVKSNGIGGNVTYAGRINTINSTLYDEDGNSVTVSVTNIGSFLGGDNEEGIEEIRYEAPRVFKTGQRAVSRNDFISILENYPGVASVNVWGENEEAAAAGTTVDYTMLNKVKMCIVLQEWELPDDTFKSTLSDYIYNISMLTVKYEFVTAAILEVIPILAIRVATGYSISQTQADVEEALAGQFSLGDTTKLGTIIKYSHLMNAIDDVEGVSYANMVLEIKKDLTASYQSYYDYGRTLDAVDILPESVRLFIDDIYITTDVDNEDGTGSFSSAGGYAISGTVDYETGLILLNVSPAPASSIYVRYQQNKERNIVPSFMQICKLEDVDVTDIRMG